MYPSMKLGLATTVAALSIAAATSAGAAVNPTSAGETVGQAVARAASGVLDCVRPAGTTFPPAFNWWISGGGMRSGAADAITLSNGACSDRP
jgi:hypothetical protein